MITKLREWVSNEPVLAANLLGGILVVLLAIGKALNIPFLEEYDPDNAFHLGAAIIAWLIGAGLVVRSRVSPVNNS